MENQEPIEKKYLVSVAFPQIAKSVFFVSDTADYKVDDDVVCETTRGLELGKVTVAPIEKDNQQITEDFPKIVRHATFDDMKIAEVNLAKAKETQKIAQQEANKLNLSMNIISAEYMLDNTKVIISYLAEERVDFRELLKVLASQLHCRIELRQIGSRDKAKMIGGIGVCGLKLCCSSFLNEFDGISITMAKNQMLALNIPKLSGHCGKLICCLKYENDTYTSMRKDFPRIGSRVKIDDQIYRITSMNILTSMIRLENPENALTLPLQDIKGKILPREDNNQNNNKSKGNNNDKK